MNARQINATDTWDGNLFVYGTLRPDCALHSKIAPAIVGEPTDCHTPGRLYHVSFGGPHYPTYPVAKFDRPGVVFGTLLTVDARHPAVQSTVHMELSSGYSPWLVPVRFGFDWDDDSHEVTALAFHYAGSGGARIQSGDWIDAAGVLA